MPAQPLRERQLTGSHEIPGYIDGLQKFRRTQEELSKEARKLREARRSGLISIPPSTTPTPKSGGQ